jgi:signal transduction histidine kinase
LPLERANINPAALLALMEEREKENVRLKRHADDLTLERDAAKAANSAKSSFLANMSHELLTTLNAIMGFSELIASEMFGPIGNPRYRDYANLIHDSGDQLLELINGVLDMSKIEAGEFELSEEQFDLEEVATQAVRFAKLAAARQSIILNLSIDLSAKLIFADKRAINKILAELISNGVKFAPQGGQVHICARRDAGGIEIAVADTGAGIDAEALKHLVASLEHEGGGRTLFQDRTGLGLALVKTLAALHGGTISIESVPSEGTVAKVRLPHAAVSDQGECTAPQHLEGTLRAFRGAA